MSMNLEEAKAYLQKESSSCGVSLYDHLSDVLLKVLTERPEDTCEAFEHLSEAVKQSRFNGVQNTVEAATQLDIDAKIHQEKWCDAAMGLFRPPIDDESPPAVVSGVSDLLDEANMFEWAGIGFSKTETFRLAIAIQNLAGKEQSTSMRLWGKILGREMDFYVAEGQVAEAYEPEDPMIEEGVSGVNRHTYWVMKDDGSYVWERLPPVSAAQILGARKLRRYIGADLDAAISGNPPFPGTERNFLRAQIARIASSTLICPVGFFTLSEDGEIEVAEEIESKSAQDLMEAANWVHLNKEVNAIYGRCTPMPPRQGEDGEEKPWEGEEFVNPLRSLSEDEQGSWKCYTSPATTVSTTGEVAIIKSLHWPGAAAVGLGKKFINIYVGDAIKYNESSYQPALPAELQTEYGVTVDETQNEDGEASLRFNNLQEQPDVLEDPAPPAEGADE